MRAVTELFVTEEALAAMYAQAAPFAPRPPALPIYLASEKWTPNDPPRQTSVDGAPIELAAEGCGSGWYRHHWRDRWVGILALGALVPNRS